MSADKADSANHERILQELTRASMEFGQYPIPPGGIRNLYVDRNRYGEALANLLKHVGVCDQRHYSDGEGIECRYVTEARDVLRPAVPENGSSSKGGDAITDRP